MIKDFVYSDHNICVYELTDGRYYVQSVYSETDLPIIEHNPHVGTWILDKKYPWDVVANAIFIWRISDKKCYGYWRILSDDTNTDRHILSYLEFRDIKNLLVKYPYIKDERGNDLGCTIRNTIDDVLSMRHIYRIDQDCYLIYTCCSEDKKRKLEYIRDKENMRQNG